MSFCVCAPACVRSAVGPIYTTIKSKILSSSFSSYLSKTSFLQYIYFTLLYPPWLLHWSLQILVFDVGFCNTEAVLFFRFLLITSSFLNLPWRGSACEGLLATGMSQGNDLCIFSRLHAQQPLLLAPWWSSSLPLWRREPREREPVRKIVHR